MMNLSSGTLNSTSRTILTSSATRSSAGTTNLVTVAAGTKIRIVAAAISLSAAGAVQGVGDITMGGTDNYLRCFCTSLASQVHNNNVNISTDYSSAPSTVAGNTITFTTVNSTGSATIWYYVENA